MRFYRVSLLFMAIFTTTASFADGLFNWPESAVYDTARGRYLISNASNGAIVSLSATGEQEYFATGFGSIRGLEIVGDTVYAASEVGVVGLDLATGQTTMTVDIAGMQFLNDITSDSSGILYVTDSNAHTVHRINPVQGTSSLLVSAGVTSPNGIFFDGPNNRLLVCISPAQNNFIAAVDLSDSSVTNLVQTPFGMLDGLTQDHQGNFYISSWETNTVYQYSSDFSTGPEEFSTGYDGPADIYFDSQNQVLVVPNFNANEVEFISLSGDLAFASYLPHFTFRDGNWITILTLANPTDSDQMVRLSAFANDGTPDATTTLTLPANGGQSDRVQNMIAGLQADIGWLTIESDTDEIAGIMTFTFVPSGGTSSLPTVYRTGTEIVFPLIENSSQWVSGFAVTNVTATTNSLRVLAYDLDGNLLETVTQDLDPHAKIVSMASSFFSVSLPEFIVLVVRSTGPVTGFALSFSGGNVNIVAVPATVIEP